MVSVLQLFSSDPGNHLTRPPFLPEAIFILLDTISAQNKSEAAQGRERWRDLAQRARFVYFHILCINAVAKLMDFARQPWPESTQRNPVKHNTQPLGRKAKSFDLPLSGLRGPISATPQFLQHRSPCFRVHSPNSLRTLPNALLLQTLQGGAHLGLAGRHPAYSKRDPQISALPLAKPALIRRLLCLSGPLL